jgi:hypothetical protein
MAKSLIRNVSLLLVLLPAFFLISSCGPGADQREQQRIEDSLRLDKERQELFERTGRMLDSVAAPAVDSL